MFWCSWVALQMCVYCSLTRSQKKQALRFLIPVRFEVWVWWFFFPRPFVCLNRDLHMEGQIWFLPRSLQLSSFQAYKLRVTHLYQLKQHSILVSVGEDEEGINPLVSQTNKRGKCICIGGSFLRLRRLPWLAFLTLSSLLSLGTLTFDAGSWLPNSSRFAYARSLLFVG